MSILKCNRHVPKKFKKIGTLLFMYVETIVSKHNNLNKNHIKTIVQKKRACQVRKCDEISEKYRIENKPVDLFKKN